MANAILYFRDESSKISDIADAQNLDSDQILEFVFPDDILEGIQETYENNIKYIPIPNQDGVRKINVQENGLMRNDFTISGVFKKEAGEGIAKLKLLRKRKQVDTFHIYGSVGLEIDNAPEFSLDPDGSAGLSIKSTSIGYAGQRTTRYDFQVVVGFGGTIV